MHIGIKPLYKFFIAIFLLSIGFGITTTAVPLYATTFSLSEWQLGILGALAYIPYIITSSIFGRLSDRRGRRPFIFGGLTLYIALCVAYFLASNIMELASVRLLEGICFALIWPSAEAFTADSTPAASRSRAVGFYSFSWSAGYMVGSFVIGIVVSLLHLVDSFLVAALFMLSAIALLFMIRQPSPKHPEAPTEFGTANTAPEARIRIPIILYTMAMWGFAVLTFYFLFPQYAGSYGITAAVIAYLIGITGLFRTLIFLFCFKIIPAIKEKMIPLGMFFLGVSMFGLWVAPNIYGFVFSASFLGLFLGVTYSFSLDYMLSKPAKGLYAGLFESSIGIGELLGPLAMGYVGFIVSPSSPYLALGVVGVLSIFLLVFNRGSHKGP